MSKTVWGFGNRRIDFSVGPLFMGVLNITPDSFSDGGEYVRKEQAIGHALKMIEQGADIIDIGGESSRPGSKPVSEQTELERVVPVIEALRKQSDVLISIDTCKSSVARAALEAGVDIVNDISAATFDKAMGEVVAEFDCPIIIMHMKGTPKTMQRAPSYKNVVKEITGFFRGRIDALKQFGIHKIILDPGIGFGKRTEDNLNILNELRKFKDLGFPLLIGLSRKSFIGDVLNRDVSQRKDASVGANVVAYLNGANILRIHDVAETRDAVLIAKAIKNI